MALPFPGRPGSKELREWGFGLLSIDGHIAGYAIRVEKGSLDPREIPDADDLASEVGELSRSLEEIRPQNREDESSIEEFKQYVAALERLVCELATLTR
ncbi:hypothetical protein [Streptomyces sp. NPDC015130]|uniref:hypothetical protein n=1 Tax=Streptomyces sp. NPDC015130 TaxID=3364940 RepID=UPI0036FF656B